MNSGQLFEPYTFINEDPVFFQMWNVPLLLLLATLRISGAEDVTAKNKTYLEQRQEHEDSKMVGMEEEDVYLSHPHSAALDPDGKFHLSWTVDSNSQVSGWWIWKGFIYGFVCLLFIGMHFVIHCYRLNLLNFLYIAAS